MAYRFGSRESPDGVGGNYPRCHRKEREPRGSFPGRLSGESKKFQRSEHHRTTRSRRCDAGIAGEDSGDARGVEASHRGAKMTSATFQVWRGARGEGRFSTYTTEISEGMVVLDAIHKIQAEQANDLAVRWNCKAGKCGSCSAEINGMPRLMCMTRLNELPIEQPVSIVPMRAFPRIKHLVTDVS